MFLLERVDRYSVDKDPSFESWVYHQSVLFFLSHFRTLAQRRKLRKDHAAATKRARKGVVRNGKVYDLPPSQRPNDPVTLCPVSDESQYTERQIWDTMGVQADPRPSHETVMDIQELVPLMPEPLQSIIHLMLSDVQHDIIAWKLGMNRAIFAAKKQEALAWLKERLS